ncbi:MAG TPA: serine--tRNA ligase [Kiritimatiellia bacterium]|nr:serine--tRNA ligase [Kiritimatiellia bacterium]
MLDLRKIREQPEMVKAGLASKRVDADIEGLLDLDRQRRAAIAEVEELKNRRNTVSKEIGPRKKAGEDITAIQAEMREVGDRITGLDARLREIEAEQKDRLLMLPNLPHASTPRGGGSEDNEVVKEWGEERAFDFEPKPHWELAEGLGLIDFERGTKLTGSGFPLYTGMGAKLQRALLQFMLDLHTTEHGYREVWPPVLVNADSMTGTGQLPKMKEDMYYIGEDDLYLAPTAEVPVTNIYRDDILPGPLPVYLTAYTPCFRREAGAAGRETRGLIRIHQFDKVELVKFVEPETSYDELESLLGNAETVLQRLGLRYRVLQLCSGDLSFAAAKCYDIELWAPGHKGWLEVSSCSNFEDFQARRANIRYRDANGKPAFVHTLNGSGVAFPRLVVALLENGQQADGSVVLPDALAPYLGGVTRIAAPTS